MSEMLKAFSSSQEKIQFDNCGTAFIDEGEGEPIVLIHGVGLSHSMWFAQASVLSKQFRVIRYDLLGHGQSKLLDKGVGINDFVQQLHNLLDYLDITAANVVGFSLGALIARQFAISDPSRLQSLVIMNSVYKRSTDQKLGVYGRALQVAMNGIGETAEAATQRWFSERFRVEQTELVETIRDQLLHNDHNSYLRSYSIFAMSDELSTGSLTELSCPVLIITGELDVGSTPEMTQALAQDIPNAKAVVVPGQRHMMPVEGADETNQHLLDFLLERDAS